MQGMQGMLPRSLGREDPLKQAMAVHSNILAWKSPWKRNLMGHSPWGYNELDVTGTDHTHNIINTFMSPNISSNMIFINVKYIFSQSPSLESGNILFVFHFSPL